MLICSQTVLLRIPSQTCSQNIRIIKMKWWIFLLIVVICVFKSNAKYIIRDDASPEEVSLVTNWQRNHDLKSLEGVLKFLLSKDGHEFKRFDIKIKELHSIRFVNESGKQNWNLAHSAKGCVINRNNLKQQGQTSGYKKTITQTKTVTVTNTAEISGTVKIPAIPLLDSFSMKFTRSEATADLHSEAIEISAPSQKVDVDPHSKVSVSYKLYTYEKVYNYLLDFEIDENSAYVFSVTYPLSSERHLRLLPEFDGSLELTNLVSTGISFRYENGKYILRNFPMTYRVSNAEINIVYGNPVELSSSDLNTSSDNEITC